MRKVKQIAFTPSDGAQDFLYALCEDGSIWLRYGASPSARWKQVPSIPDDTEEDTE